MSNARRRRKCGWGLVWCLLVLLCALTVHATSSSSSRTTTGASNNPYHILGVSQDATQDDIQRAYKSKCLQYHPDKNGHRSTAEQAKCEEMFKDVQTAYAQIGNPSSRHRHDAQQQQQQQTRGSHTGSYTDFEFANADILREFWNRQSTSPYHSSSHVPIFRFYSTTPSPFSSSSLFQRGGLSTPTFVSQHLTCNYVQHVPVSIPTLYTGTPPNQPLSVSLQTNVWKRLVAAVRGKCAYLMLYQSLLYALPLWRISRRLALSLAVCVFWQSLPPAPVQTTYALPLLPGYKGGTKLVFKKPIKDGTSTTSFPDATIVFVLQEESHPKYWRQDHDLHICTTLTRHQARTGCTKTWSDFDNLTVTIPPNRIVRSGQCLVIPGKGWPRIRKRNNNTLSKQQEHGTNVTLAGDLILHVKLKREKPQRQRSKKPNETQRS